MAKNFCSKCGSALVDGKCPKCKEEKTSFSSNGYIYRSALKNAAKDKLNGNFGKLLLPIIIVAVIMAVVGGISSIFPEESMLGAVVALVLEVLVMPLSMGVVFYYLNFVRGNEVKVEDLFRYYSKIWPIFVLTFLIGLFTGLWTLLFIIPGIIAALSYSMSSYIFVDNPDMNATDIISESKRLMTGYKWDYFVFSLSFIGWGLLVGVTFGIAIIYVGPYMSVAQVMYYEELKKIKA